MNLHKLPDTQQTLLPSFSKTCLQAGAIYEPPEMPEIDVMETYLAP